MLNFDYQNPTRIIFGKNRILELSRLVPADAKVLITFGGGGAVHSGLIAKVKKALGYRSVVEFGDIEPNPQFETLMKAVSLVCAENCNFLPAVGGGSVIDGTKFIAQAAYVNGEPRSLLDHWNITAGHDTDTSRETSG